MTKPNNTLTTLLASSVLALFASACGGDPNDFSNDQPIEDDSAAIFGSDSCKNIDIHITNRFEDNGRPVEIRILKVEAYSASEGRYLTEDLPNETIANGSARWFNDQDLAYGENDLLTKWRITFNYRETDGDWSDSTTDISEMTDVRCIADMNFELTVD